MATYMEQTYSNDGSLRAGAGAGVGGGSGSGGSSFGSQLGEADAAPIPPPLKLTRSYSPSRPPTSAEIDAVIAAAMANAPPRQTPPVDAGMDEAYVNRSGTPLMTNLLPSAVGADGRVNLFVGNLPYRVRWQDLKDLFRKAGTVLRADVSLGPDNRSRGYGTVLLGSREDAARAIDRFNGYTWQTRTLEVRPDRLPPEYEAQPHVIQHHHQNQAQGHGRPPPGYPYHNNNGPNGMPFPGQGPPWNSGHGPVPHRGGPGPGPGVGPYGPSGMSMGMGMGPLHPPFNHSHSHPNAHGHPQPHPSHGLPSLPGSHQSPNLVNGQPGPPPPVRDPMSGLNIAPSPLAGALTGNVVLPAPPSVSSDRRDSIVPFSTERRDSLAPFQHLPDAAFIRRGSTPKPPTSRPTSVIDTSTSTLADQPGNLGPSGTPTAVPASISAAGSEQGTSASPAMGAPAPSDSRSVQGDVAPHFPVQIDGLAHQGMGLGPPSNLHDRVVFVSNMPLSMQWQDLKDMLRPAGLIMRADVAQDEQRRPRGYGTALFATESDAARAVHMFNGRDIGGRRIRVYLEKESRPVHPSAEQSPQQAAHSDTIPPDSYHSVPPSPVGARIPWGINTALAQQTPQRTTSGSDTSPGGFPGGPTPGPNFRSGHHPGPISMPPFHPMGMGMGMGMGMDSPNPLSPLQTRGLPPMTPSMPGFIFNAYPDTPPIHHHFLTPGAMGSFSPGIPVTSPTGFGYNPFINAAPGGPIESRGGFSHFHSGSAALATPTTTAFPPGNPIHGYGGAPGGPMSANGTPNTYGSGNGNTNANGNGEYFPYVPGAGPESPLRNRFPSAAAAMPLNARDRLASTAPAPLGSGAAAPGPASNKERIRDLVKQMSMLEAEDPHDAGAGADADADGMITPTDTPGGTPGAGSPTLQQLERRRIAARERAGAGVGVAPLHIPEPSGEEVDDRGRYSLDGARPVLDPKIQQVGLRAGIGADLSERRASYGDAGL